MHSSSTIGAAFLIAMLASTCVGGTEVYKWVDEQGKVHYGDRPTGAQSEKIEVKTTAPARDPDAATRRERTRRLLDQFDDERAEQQQKEAERAQELAERKRRCEKAREDLEQYRNAGYLYEKTKDGSRRVLSDEERAAAEAEMQKLVDHWCKPAG